MDLFELSIPKDFIINQQFLLEIEAQDKVSQCITYLNNLPNGESITRFSSFLFECNQEELHDLVKILYSKKDPAELTKEDYTTGIAQKLFLLEPSSIGRGELFIAWILEDSKINGLSGKGHDLTDYLGRKYELKDYSNDPESADIRLGGEAKVSNFEWWHDFKLTLKTIMDLKPDEYSLLPEKIFVDFYDFHTQALKASNGEFGKKRFNIIYKFLCNLNNYIKNPPLSNGYRQLILKGINVSDLKYNIKNIEKVEFTDDKLYVELDKSKEGSNELHLVNLIIKLQDQIYIKHPNRLQEDMDASANKLLDKDVTYIIFRSTGPVITKDLVYSRVTSGAIKIIERWKR